MSLTAQETARTSRELVANLEQSGVDAATVAVTLNFSAERLARTLGVTHDSRPADVWLLRDFLDQVNRDRGHTPIPWSVLTDGARSTAATWFRLRTPPPSPTRGDQT